MRCADPPGPEIEIFFDRTTSTFTYLVIDPETRRAAVVDPVLDFDLASGRIRTDGADLVLKHLLDHECMLDWILETHAHADHLSAAAYLQQATGGRTAIGAGIRDVQSAFAPIFGMAAGIDPARDFDCLWGDDDTFNIGALTVRVWATPGHTPDGVTYLIGGSAFVGDSLFMPERGTARCDFPGGDANALYASVQRLYSLPDDTQLYVCHDYPAAGNEPRACDTVRSQKAANIHIRSDTSPAVFVAHRRARDVTLSLPHLLIPALQVNIRGGRLPAPDDSGRVYLRLPVNAFAAHHDAKLLTTD